MEAIINPLYLRLERIKVSKITDDHLLQIAALLINREQIVRKMDYTRDEEYRKLLVDYMNMIEDKIKEILILF